MARYILKRLIKSILSIFIVVSLVVMIVFKLVPVTRAFLGDTAFQKLKGNSKEVYRYSKLEQLGYLDYIPMNELFAELPAEQAKRENAGSSEQQAVLEKWKAKGYTILPLNAADDLQGSTIAYRNYNVFELVGNFFKHLVVFDHKNYIQDPNNPNLERYIRIEKDYNGIPAIVGSGTLHKYLLYFDGNFPFIHQNFITFRFGESFPTQKGIQTLDVIATGQGKMKNVEQTFPTGLTAKSPIKQHTLKYKTEPDALDKQRFHDNYADAEMSYESPSMIGTSYIFGILALILQYAIAVPFAIAMAKRVGGWIDRIGIAYINLVVSVPTLAFIFFLKYIGLGFGMPDKFPHYGFGDVRSYIMPIIILALMSTPYLMMWVRRYMVDQSTSDYVKFAKAKGLSSSEISRNHIFKNAIIPIVNGLPSSIILAISGAVLTESVFAIPGMGKMLPDAIKAGNNNMVITLTFIFTALSIFSVFAGDLLMTVVDPRISLNAKKGE
ncbi:MAG: ABC transporter permease [Peptoniphilaceae bacterium]|nr:ABC transporter permease [Peptoniphilaceae bacterium]MDD7434615.1 ABC transporter permease [Peptoniphilaceae bacterium]MDY3075114.1 ABC transporter permease [Peptoniphilaceae bacterium]MDY3986829.1 ABC transporter permease [Peptoniphilaceae bacterium]MDY4196647.1 ABC transporter permease [Peptoniphilaceae bacterium]